MKIKLFKEFNSMSDTCNNCGEEFWGEDDICDDCKDSDLEDKDDETFTGSEKVKKQLPFFGVPTTKSQNIYNL